MPTPNPDAMKFTLDVSLPDRILASRGEPVEDAFTRVVLAIDGVASVFGLNDFVTITRARGADWDPIVCAVQDAAATYLLAGTGGPSAEAVERARSLLRDATRRPATTVVEIRSGPPRRRDG
jgi:Scaffold protein Nfu/NifU N terminal